MSAIITDEDVALDAIANDELGKQAATQLQCFRATTIAEVGGLMPPIDSETPVTFADDFGGEGTDPGRLILAGQMNVMVPGHLSMHRSEMTPAERIDLDTQQEAARAENALLGTGYSSPHGFIVLTEVQLEAIIFASGAGGMEARQAHIGLHRDQIDPMAFPAMLARMA